MENSIKSIWQEGFLKNNDLIAPKVVNLYDRKSEHIIDKYKRMFKKNELLFLHCEYIPK